MILFVTAGIIALLAAMSPGPDFVLISRYCLGGSRRVGMGASFGISIGLSVHILLAIVGLTALLQSYPVAFGALKYLGAAYFAYLGIKILRSRGNSMEVDGIGGGWLEAFRAGFFCNVLNPKAALFILSFFSQVLGPNEGSLVKFAVGVELILVTLIWFVALVFLLTHEVIHAKMQKIQTGFTTVMGILLLGFSLKLVFSPGG